MKTNKEETPIRILIADDHAVVCKGIEQILSNTPDLVVAGQANTGEEVLEKVKQGGWNLVLLDISMPGPSGLKLLKLLKKGRPDLPVIMLSVYPEERYGLDFLKAGASAYLTKTSPPEQLIDAIRKVAKGETIVGPVLAQKIALDQIHSNELALHQSLSEREYQVLCMLGSGKTVSEIARELSLSVKTVSSHRSRILVKMNMKTSAQLTHYCVKNFLVD